MNDEMKELIKRLKKLWAIADDYDSDIRILERRIVAAQDLIADRTNVHVDIAPSKNGPHQVIVIGRYNGRDYIQTYSIHADSFVGLVRQLKDMEREYGNIKRVDAVPMMRAVIGQGLDLS